MSSIASLRRQLLAFGTGAALLFCLTAVAANDTAAVAATLRTTLAKRLPNLPQIDEITQAPIPGLYELRLGSQVIYSDAQGSFVIEGEIIDTAKHTNLTQDRIDKLTAFDFAKLPLKDAVVWKQGTGARKLVVFADPNCTYCKKLERDLNGVPDITVYTFMIPILGGDSPQKARDIWCSKESGKVWRGWMVNGAPPPAASTPCDTAALSRNIALSQRHGVNGTPALVFEDSARNPGILSAERPRKEIRGARHPPQELRKNLPCRLPARSPLRSFCCSPQLRRMPQASTCRRRRSPTSTPPSMPAHSPPRSSWACTSSGSRRTTGRGRRSTPSSRSTRTRWPKPGRSTRNEEPRDGARLFTASPSS